ncbi:ABC transporter substrate-binding protein [Pseudochelatococcus lubricantis]|uniref:ABC transporter substrate-binding protein n=1 Tax=Pseudochelatococcus lubricantis TaxID=1538102 RepID=UPI00366BA7EF
MMKFHVIAALALAISGVATGLRPAEAADKPTVKVGYFSQLHDAAILDLPFGDLKDKVNFEYVKFQRYADAAIALVRGDIDISSLGYANLITEAAKNTDPNFKFITGLARGAINLVCSNDVKIADWPDLKGKTVGVVSGFPEIFIDDALRTHGQSEKDITKVNFAVAGPPVLQALKDKTVECVSVFEPFGATAVGGKYAYYPPTNIGDNSFKGLNNGIAASTAFIEKHGDLVGDIRNAANKSTAKFREDEGKWVDFIISSQGFPKDIVEIGVKRVTLDSTLYPAEAVTLSANMAALGLLKAKPSTEQLQRFFLQQ